MVNKPFNPEDYKEKLKVAREKKVIKGEFNKQFVKEDYKEKERQKLIKKRLGVPETIRKKFVGAFTSQDKVVYRPILKKESTQTIKVQSPHYQMVAPSFNFQQTRKNMLEWGREGR
jgi:hypothetical protein